MVNADWFKFRIHLRNVNVCHFEIVKDTGVNTLSRGHLQWHDHSPEFHENLRTGSNITTRRDGQTNNMANFHKLHFPF